MSDSFGCMTTRRTQAVKQCFIQIAPDGLPSAVHHAADALGRESDGRRQRLAAVAAAVHAARAHGRGEQAGGRHGRLDAGEAGRQGPVLRAALHADSCSCPPAQQGRPRATEGPARGRGCWTGRTAGVKARVVPTGRAGGRLLMERKRRCRAVPIRAVRASASRPPVCVTRIGMSGSMDERAIRGGGRAPQPSAVHFQEAAIKPISQRKGAIKQSIKLINLPCARKKG